MQFHDYSNFRNRYAKHGRDNPFALLARSGMKSREFRSKVIEMGTNALEGGKLGRRDEELLRVDVQAADMEQAWADCGRPFYNVWPVVIPLSMSLRLDIPIKLIELPFSALLLRFSRGHEPLGISTAMLLWDQAYRLFSVHCHFPGSGDTLSLSLGQVGADETVEYFLDRALKVQKIDVWGTEREQTCGGNDGYILAVRLAVFVALLSHDNDLVTPVVLAKDEAEYNSTSDPDVKKWLEDRAARRMGRGFDIGKRLQEEKDRSPHWRNPHPALFWTGKGRTKPVIKMRMGGVVNRASMAEVPTGYLGPETDADDIDSPEKTPRESLSKSQRFDILQRDDFRCQLCGRAQSDNVKLHVDHRVPLAKGGSNEDRNLWTLCEDCNLGKSDKSLK